MTKEQLWQLFKETGNIKYYLQYKQLTRKESNNDKKN